MSQEKSSKPQKRNHRVYLDLQPQGNGDYLELYEVYTDGASRGNGKKNSAGGYAAVWKETKDGIDYWRKISNGEPYITNQQAELKAALLFLDEVPDLESPGFKVEIYTDSAYLYRCWREGWWRNWQASGWKTSSRTPVSNRDLWERLIPYFQQNWLTIHHVRGHVGIEGNERADTEACRQADRIKKEIDNNGNI